MSQQEFRQVLGSIATSIGGMPLDDQLQRFLSTKFPTEGQTFQRLKSLCAEGEREGWLMQREAEGIKFGRAVKPGTDAGEFSVDVVRMKNVKGPHHIHTTGEIGAIMTIEGAPKFDDRDEGWYVYPPGSDHHPTVSDGDAYVLYLLPEGAIEFTGK